MRVFLIMFLILCQITALGQNEPEQLNNKAFEYYIHKKNLDSALLYYKLLQQGFPEFRPNYINYQIGDCYFEKGNKDLAKKYFSISLNGAGFNDIFTETACLHLGDMYFDAGNYISALAYYDSSTSFYRAKVYHMSRHTFIEGNIPTIYKKAFCLDRLDKLDSAISIMTPHIFIDFTDYHINQSEAKNIVDFYVSLLKKKYSDRAIKKKIKTSMREFVYKREIDTFFLKPYPMSYKIQIICYFRFLDKKIMMGGVSMGSTDFNETTPPWWRKKNIKKDFCKRLTYQRLRHL